jgi:V-type H+-transporting ATPase subunit d
MEMALFNVDDGFAEAVVRGYRSAFLTQEDYRRLGGSDNIEGMIAFLHHMRKAIFRYSYSS